MSFTWKQFSQARYNDILTHTLYIPTAGTYAAMKSFNAVNVSALPTTFSFFADPTGVVYDKSQALFYNYPLSVGQRYTLELNKHISLDENGSFGISNSTANAVNFTIGGCEGNFHDMHPGVYKMLGQRRPPVAHGALLLYSPPANTQVIVTAIFVCNTENSSDTFSIYWDHDGVVISQDTAMCYNEPIAKNDTYILQPNWTLNENAGSIYCSTATGSTCTFTAFGIEFPIM